MAKRNNRLFSEPLISKIEICKQFNFYLRPGNHIIAFT